MGFEEDVYNIVKFITPATPHKGIMNKEKSRMFLWNTYIGGTKVA